MVVSPHRPDPAGDLRRRADRICVLILAESYPEASLDREIDGLRRWCVERLPDRVELFDLVYGARFRRLREQFRTDPPAA